MERKKEKKLETSSAKKVGLVGDASLRNGSSFEARVVQHRRLCFRLRLDWLKYPESAGGECMLWRNLPNPVVFLKG